MGQNLTSQLNGENPDSNVVFNPFRLTFARNRRGLKKTELAKKIGVTLKSITDYEAGQFPPKQERLLEIASALRFPPDFFYGEEQIEVLSQETVSFRAMTKMSANLKNVALATGSIAVMLNEWIESQFTLPELDLPDLGRDLTPEAAAIALRIHWGLGNHPIKNMVHLLEAKGVRVFSLSIDAKEVDAFSMWMSNTPFVLLNTRKSAERSRFDAAHELGHLVLHRHGHPNGNDAEKEADAFASCFLMPTDSVLATKLHYPNLDTLIKIKRHWGVSVAAINFRLHSLGMTTEWINRSLCIQIAKAGYRTNEPNSLERETSQIFEKVFTYLRKNGMGKSEIAKQLKINIGEIDELTYGLLKLGAVPNFDDISQQSQPSVRERPKLTIIK